MIEFLIDFTTERGNGSWNGLPERAALLQYYTKQTSQSYIFVLFAQLGFGDDMKAMADDDEERERLLVPKEMPEDLTSERIQFPPNEKVPCKRFGAASAVTGGKLYIFGGGHSKNVVLDDFWTFSFDERKWEEVEVQSDVKPSPRLEGAFLLSDDKQTIYLFGGRNPLVKAGPGLLLNDLWKFDIESKWWTCIHGPMDPEDTVRGGQGQAPARRFGHASVIHNDKLIVFGGCLRRGTRSHLDKLHVFDFSTATWTEIQAEGDLPRNRSCAAWAKQNKHVYIHGGCNLDGDYISDFFVLDLETCTWKKIVLLGTPPSPRFCHSFCFHGGRMYLYGGCYKMNWASLWVKLGQATGLLGSRKKLKETPLADMYVFDLDTYHWSQIKCIRGDSPSPCSGFVWQVYQDSIYMFGGSDASTAHKDFFRFSLKTMSMHSAPKE